MLSEAAVEDRIRLRAPRLGGLLWRNNSGAFRDDTGRLIRYGLANDSAKLNKEIKSSDLIGILPVLIRPEHVGRLLGLFVACEVKREGWTHRPNDAREKAQAKFIRLVVERGGLGLFAQSDIDYETAVRSIL